MIRIVVAYVAMLVLACAIGASIKLTAYAIELVIQDYDELAECRQTR